MTIPFGALCLNITVSRAFDRRTGAVAFVSHLLAANPDER